MLPGIEKAREHSVNRIDRLIGEGLQLLTFNDITTEGVDFHCSSVLDFVLSDTSTQARLSASLRDASKRGIVKPLPQEASDSRAWLENVLMEMIWTFSAGLNLRLPLTSHSEEMAPNEKEAKEIWKDAVLPRTKFFAENYVRQRLARFQTST